MNRITKADVELAMWRSGLVSGEARANHVISAAKDIARASNILRRINIEKCNGVPKRYDAARREWEMGLDDSDSARHEKQEIKARDDLKSAARDVLKRGLVFKFYTDPRASVACRISDKDNIKDCFV